MTLREQILDNLKTRLEKIVTGKKFGDYVCETTVKGVHPWRKVELKPTDCPAICLYDTKAPKSGQQLIGKHTYDLRIEIVGLVTKGAVMSQVRGLLADIVAVCFADTHCSGLSETLEIEEQDLDRADYGDVIGAVNIVLSVTYRAPRGRI